jgi:thioredoxin-related protein
MKLKQYLLFLMLWLAAAFTPVYADDAEAFFNQSFGDLQEELETAKEENKKAILIMFEMDECPFCHWMKQQVLNKPEVQHYYHEHFRILAVDTEGDIEMTTFDGNTMAQKDLALNTYRVRATPVFQFIDLEGNPIKRARYTGATKDAEEFLLLGKFVAEGHYKNSYFSKYKREAKNK